MTTLSALVRHKKIKQRLYRLHNLSQQIALLFHHCGRFIILPLYESLKSIKGIISSTESFRKGDLDMCVFEEYFYEIQMISMALSHLQIF